MFDRFQDEFYRAIASHRDTPWEQNSSPDSSKKMQSLVGRSSRKELAAIWLMPRHRTLPHFARVLHLRMNQTPVSHNLLTKCTNIFNGWLPQLKLQQVKVKLCNDTKRTGIGNSKAIGNSQLYLEGTQGFHRPPTLDSPSPYVVIRTLAREVAHSATEAPLWRYTSSGTVADRHRCSVTLSCTA